MHIRADMTLRTAGWIAPLVLLACSNSDAGKKEVAPEPAPAAAPVEPTAPITDGDWVPKEFTTGIKKFKDPGVYVDGVAKGVLRFGELPLSLEPVWHEEEAAVEFKKGHKGPRHKIVKQRRYRWTEYFEALGIDVKSIKEMHIYGGSKRPVAAIVKGEDLRARGDDFMFRFGSDVFGKPIPACPPNIADGNCPDNIRAIALYIKRTPPIRKRGYFYLNGERLTDIPYYGPPLRGGVRVYLDGPMVAYIKRHKLAEGGEALKVTRRDGEVGYKFVEFLKRQGVDTGSIKEAWLVHRDKFVKRIDRDELMNATFVAGKRRSGRILFGDDKIETSAIALSSERIAASDIPRPLPHEIHK